MALRCTLLVLATACVMGLTTAERRAKDSCMVHWIVQGGVSHSTSVHVEKRLLSLGATPGSIAQTPSFLVTFLLKTTAAESNKLRSCFGGTSKDCQKYSPCKHGGKCTMSLSKKTHVCNCPLDYTGDFCQIPHPAPLRDLRLLEKSVQRISSTVKKLAESSATKKDMNAVGTKVTAVSKDVKSLRKTQEKHGRLWKCHYPFVARKHFTWYNKANPLNNGQLRKVKFVKKQENTILRLLYSSNIYEQYQHRSTWKFKIDGQECSRPSPITILMHHQRRNDLYIPSVLLGTCEATKRGRIGKGSHTISVHVHSKDGHSGWITTSFLEIREICPDQR